MVISIESGRSAVAHQAMEQFFSQQFYNRGPLKHWLNELAEVAHRAVVKQEILESSTCDICYRRYCVLFCRKAKGQPSTLSRDGLIGLVSGSDVNDVLIPIYEHYRNVCSNAIDKKLKRHQYILCSHLAELLFTSQICKPRVPPTHSPLTYLPVGYLSTCVEMAERAGMDDVVFQAADALLNVVKTARKISVLQMFTSTILKELMKMAVYFLAKNNVALCNRIITHMMTVDTSRSHKNILLLMK